MVYARRYIKKNFSRRRRYGGGSRKRTYRKRRFVKSVKRVIRSSAETKGVMTSLSTVAGGIASSWTVVPLFSPAIENSSVLGVVGRKFYPNSIYFKHAVMTGGQATSLLDDDVYNQIRIVLLETTTPITATIMDQASINIDTPIQNTLPFGNSFPGSGLKVHIDRLMLTKPSMVTGSENNNLLPQLYRVKLFKKLSGPVYIPTNAAGVTRRFYLCFKSDSAITPNPGFVSGQLCQTWKDDS